jgi:F420-0:gamma-glutamyl ligase-like protein
MTKYKLLAVITGYWKPGDNYIQEIVRHVQGKLHDGDFVVVSEKAVSTALNNIVDESRIKPSFGAKMIARIWMRMIWGYCLGPLCHLHRNLLQQIREYPLLMGSSHKQASLQHVSILQTLMFGSEGGIDGSNLPYSYVSLPLDNAKEVAQEIHARIWLALRKKVCVIIADTDKTFSFRNFHFAPRSNPIKGIHPTGGFLAYVLGRMFRLKSRATPLTVVGCGMSVEQALDVAEGANRARGFGAARTVWGMAAKFKVGLDEVSWEMLETVTHKPIVIIRGRR